MGRGGSFRARVLRTGLGTLFLTALNTGLTLATGVFLARLLGAEGYGAYAYALALVSVLAIPAGLGLPILLVREVAAYEVHVEWGRLRGLIQRANQITIALALGVAAIAAVGAWLLADRFTPEGIRTFAWALLLLPLGALGELRGAALRGLRRLIAGQFPEKVIRPGFLAAFLAFASTTGLPLGPDSAMILHVGAVTIAFVVGAILLWRALPPEVRKAAPRYEDRRWLRSALPLGFQAGAQIVHHQSDILMLGFFAGAADVGIYRVAGQASALVGFALLILNTILAPHMARLHASGDLAGLQEMVTWGVRIIVGWALPIAAMLFVAGNRLLLLFGGEFAGGHLTLSLLCLGQLVNASVGPVGNLLNMTGHERDTAAGLAYSSAANVVLNAALIPGFGMEGAALATVLSTALWNLLLWRRIRQRTGIDASVFRGLLPNR